MSTSLTNDVGADADAEAGFGLAPAPTSQYGCRIPENENENYPTSRSMTCQLWLNEPAYTTRLSPVAWQSLERDDLRFSYAHWSAGSALKLSFRPTF